MPLAIDVLVLIAPLVGLAFITWIVVLLSSRLNRVLREPDPPEDDDDDDVQPGAS